MVLKCRAFWSFNRKIRFGKPYAPKNFVWFFSPNKSWHWIVVATLYLDLKEERHWKMVATLDTNAKSKPDPKPDPSLSIQNRIWNHVVGSM